jgi:hypothetical protein
MSSMDRRSLLTAMLGACVAAGAIGAAASSSMAVPLAPPVKPEAETAEADGHGESQASVHNAQYFVVRRRPRRRWVWRPIRRRRRVYFY